MPPLEYADHWQDAICWDLAGHDEYGQPTVKQGRPLKVRWEQTFREARTSMDSVVLTEAIVHVSEPIEIGSILWEGKISDLPAMSSDDTKLYEVVFYESTTDLKNRFMNRVLYLRRFRSTLPAVVN